jgi:hypothetical protein
MKIQLLIESSPPLKARGKRLRAGKVCKVRVDYISYKNLCKEAEWIRRLLSLRNLVFEIECAVKGDGLLG